MLAGTKSPLNVGRNRRIARQQTSHKGRYGIFRHYAYLVHAVQLISRELPTLVNSAPPIANLLSPKSTSLQLCCALRIIVVKYYCIFHSLSMPDDINDTTHRPDQEPLESRSQSNTRREITHLRLRTVEELDASLSQQSPAAPMQAYEGQRFPARPQTMQEEIDEAKAHYLYREPLVFEINRIRVKHAGLRTMEAQRDALIGMAERSGLAEPLIKEEIASIQLNFATTADEERTSLHRWVILQREAAEWMRAHPLTPVSAEATRYLDESLG